MLREILSKEGAVSLALTSNSRHRWQKAGLTFAQRDNAADWLVRAGEAVYRDLRCRNHSVGTTVHIVAVEHPEAIERSAASPRWYGLPQ
jgi:hypothetical protein